MSGPGQGQHYYDGILPHFIFQGAMNAELDKLRVQLNGTDASVQACANIDDATRQSWNLQYAEILKFINDNYPVGWFFSGELMSQTQQYEDVLVGWLDKVTANKCVPKIPIDRGQENLVPGGDYKTIAMYIAITAASIAGAYIVGTVAHMAKVFAPPEGAASMAPRPVRYQVVSVKRTPHKKRRISKPKASRPKTQKVRYEVVQPSGRRLGP